MTIKVAYLRSTPPMLITGAEVSMFDRLNYLKTQFNWTSNIYGFTTHNEVAEIKSILIKRDSQLKVNSEVIEAQLEGLETKTFIEDNISLDSIKKNLSTKLQNDQVNIIFVNARDDLIVQYALTLNLPIIYFLTEDFFVRPGQVHSNDHVSRQIFNENSNIVVPSHFLAGRVQQSWKIEPKVYLDVVNSKIASPGMLNSKRFVSMLHPYQHKGIEVVIELARFLPNIPFLITTGFGEPFLRYKQDLVSLPNVSLRPFSPDISGILKESLMVLVPSLCRDVFPRIILEAMSAGVPVVSSDIGGCREAGGNAAHYVPIRIKEEQVLGDYDLLAWIKSMKEILTAEDYSALSERVSNHFKNYRIALDKDMKDFNSWCLNLINRAS